jgi:Luciferase-like monooxygenase
MKFGYFTLSDNNDRNKDRTPNQCVSDILDQALYAEKLGMHSVWIGEHHFSTLGVNSAPEVLIGPSGQIIDILKAKVASAGFMAEVAPAF